MHPTIVAAIISAIAAIVVAIIGIWAHVKGHKPKIKDKEPLSKPNYEDISDAYRLGNGIAGLVFAASINSKELKNENQLIMGLAARLIPQDRFPSVHLLMQQVFATGDFQTANALNQEIIKAIFDSHSPAVQVGYILGEYIPPLTISYSQSKQVEILSMTLSALTPFRGTVYKAKDVFPKHFISWYEDILAKRNVTSAASKIVDWFNSLK
jgi:hypothetical protein